jgi:hypothetical protein
MNVLFVHNRIPRPDHRGSDVRMMQVIDSFIDCRHSVSFVSMRPVVELVWAEALRERGIKILFGTLSR